MFTGVDVYLDEVEPFMVPKIKQIKQGGRSFMPKREEVVEETQPIMVDPAAFADFIASLENANQVIGDAIQMGKEFLGEAGEVVEEGAEASAEEGLDLNAMDETALLNLADEYQINVPRKLTTADQIRDFLYEALQAGEEAPAEEVVEEEVVEEDPPPPARAAVRPAAPARVAPAPRGPAVSAPAPRGRVTPPAPRGRVAAAPAPAAVRGKLKAAVRGRAR